MCLVSIIHTSSLLDCLLQVPSDIKFCSFFFFFCHLTLISIPTSLLFSMKVTEIHLKEDANMFICIFICLQGWLFTSAIMKLHMTLHWMKAFIKLSPICFMTVTFPGYTFLQWLHGSEIYSNHIIIHATKFMSAWCPSLDLLHHSSTLKMFCNKQVFQQGQNYYFTCRIKSDWSGWAYKGSTGGGGGEC